MPYANMVLGGRVEPVDAGPSDSVGAILSYIDDAIQFHEAQEPREPRDDDEVDMDAMDDG